MKELFNKWFCLKERQNFTINPQVNLADSQYYFGRDDIKERLIERINHSFIHPGVPKMMIWGPYGSGKTQTLFYLEYFLKNHTEVPGGVKPHTLYVTVEMQAGSKAPNLHMQLMEALSKEVVSSWVKKLFDTTPNLDSALSELTDEPNIALALKELRIAGDSSFMAWRWLTGQILSKGELNSLQLTRNLGEVGAKDMVKALVVIGNMANRVGEKLIFLIDELEELQNVKAGDAAESIHQYLRNLSDDKNSSAGFMIGFKADVIDDAPEILQRGDIKSRVGSNNYIDIPTLPAIADVKTFMRELLTNLTDKNKVEAKINELGADTEVGIFPFERPAFELLADYATQDITRALPRFIINAINECAIQAWDKNCQLIDESIVNKVAPFVFA